MLKGVKVGIKEVKVNMLQFGEDTSHILMEEGQTQDQLLGQWQGRFKKTGTLLLMAETPFYTCSKVP